MNSTYTGGRGSTGTASETPNLKAMPVQAADVDGAHRIVSVWVATPAGTDSINVTNKLAVNGCSSMGNGAADL